MKKGWQIKKLGEICQFINGRAYNKQELLNEGKYTVLRVGNFFTSDHWYYSDLELDENKYCDTGDLLYAWSASFGPKIWDGGKVIYHYHIWKVIPNKDLVTKEFLYHLLDWDKDRIKIDQGAGTTMTHVSKGSMEERLVNIPPLPEQQRIVSVLDEAFASIAQAKSNAERNLVNARELFESVLENVFSNSDFTNNTLSDAAEIISGYGFSSRDFSPNNSIKSIKITNVGVREFVEESDNLLPSSFQSEYKKVLVKEADIVIALTRSVIANGLKVAIVPKSYDKSLLNQRVAALRAKNDIVLNSFLYLFLCSERVADYVRKQANTLMQPNLSIADLHNLPIPLPTLAEQRAIVGRLEALSAETGRLEEIYQSKVESLEELRRVLLGKAFSGEL